MIFFLVFITGFLAAVMLTPLAERVAVRTGAIDHPAARRIHTHPVPRLGGVPIFFALLSAIGVSLAYPREAYEMPRLLGLVLGLAIMFLIGVVDDHHELKSLPQLIAQLLVAGIVVMAGVMINEISNPLGGTLYLETGLAIVFTLFWIAGMINTINWLDGIDGLASGVTLIASGVMFVHTYRLHQYSIALLVLALIGAVLGFWLFNFFPARIFMGSGGANVLGLAVGVLAIIGGAKVATVLLVLSVPILDVAWQIYHRMRLGQSPFVADRGHLHHRLLALGLSQRAIVILYYGLTAFLGMLALLLPSGVYKLIALVIVGLGALMILIRIGQQTSVSKKPRG